jgi:hypothetical protein
LELDLRGDVTFLAARLIGRPVLGQVEPPIQRGVTRPRGVRQEDTDLAVVDLALPAAPLAVDTAGFRALLGELAVRHAGVPAAA